MSRALVLHGFVALALASCATVSGLADKETVDCPGGCADASPTPAPTSTGTTDGAPPDVIADGDPPPDAEPAFVKPDGWELVAVAVTANGGALPACPTGFDDPSDVGTSPTATADTCECATCTVTQQATCTGRPAVARGDANDTACTTAIPSLFFDNAPAGACNTDLGVGTDRTGHYYKVKLAPASGGGCTPGAPTPHPERVSFTDRRRVCDETARCSGNVCDATVPAPFVACVASAKGTGDEECPMGFPQKLVAASANVTCGGGCSCTTTRTCTGTFTFYKDNDCQTGAATFAADDTCRNPNLSGAYAAYRVTATPTTTCAGAGTANAVVAPANARTICCR